MTRSLLTTEFRPSSADRLKRLVGLARALVAFERLWPGLWPATGIAGVFLTAALLDLFAPLAWPLHALILACLVTSIGLTLYLNLQHVVWPGWSDGARRLERDSDLAHRPISEADDALAAGAGDPEAEELWQAHLAARLNRMERLRLALPHSELPKKDPRALRYGVLLLAAAALAFAGNDSLRRLGAAFSPNAGMLATLDAWIEPPAYTGEGSIYLGREAKLAVPVGSILHLRVHGADHRPSVTLDDARFDGGEGEYAGEAKLSDSGRVRVRAGGHTIGSWKIAIIPDNPPVIGFAQKPSATERQALKLTYKASDDYGVTSARAFIKPHGREGAPLVVDLQPPAKSGTMTTFRDLTEHPYAGLDVDITLQAIDAAGNTATSNTVTFKLPQRLFTDPLARSLIEQRQDLASTGGRARGRVAKTLDALTYAPEIFFQGKEGTYLAMRMAFRSTQGAETEPDFKRVEDLLWQTAVGLEQGGLLTMAEQLRRLQQMIMQAMAQGAPQDEIDALLQRYNELMQRYLAALAQNNPGGSGAMDPNAKVLGSGDLDALLKAIQALMAAGDRVRAMQLMAMLQSLLENVQVGGGNGQGGGGNAASDQALRDMSELLGRQRMLLDKTFRQSGGNGDPKDGGAKGLSQQQGQLKGDLGAMQKKSGGRKSPADNNLDKAGRLMGEAQEALGLSDFPRATTLQKYVLDELRKGAEALAKAAGQGQGKGEAQGKNGESKDPLGRAAGNSGRGGGDNVRIPDASVLQRARDILLELRRRAGQQGRPKEELDYIDRLLKQF